MKNEFGEPENEPLRELLQTWRVERPLRPGFQDKVWRRIRRLQPEGLTASTWWTMFLQSVRRALQEPLGATAYLSALLAAGLALGYWSAELQTRQTETAWRSAYLRAVVPGPAVEH